MRIGRRWLLLGVAMAGLIAILALIVGVGNQIGLINTVTTGESQTLRTSLTQTAAFTAMPATLVPATAAASPTALPSEEAGFTLTVADPARLPLIADGLSDLLINVNTRDEALVGRLVTFVVQGGGTVNPVELPLPPLNTTSIITYTSGQSASSVRVEAILSDGIVSQRTGLDFVLAAEDVALQATVGLPLPDTVPPVVPVTFALVNPAARGQYNLRITLGSGAGVGMAPGEVIPASFDIALSDAPQTLYFTQTGPEADAGVNMRAQLTNRSDIESFETRLYWSNLTQQLFFTDLSGFSPFDPVPEAGLRYEWPLTDTFYRTCLIALNLDNVAHNPPLLQLRYISLLLDVRLRTQTFSLEPDVWYTTSTNPLNFLMVGGQSCISLFYNQPGLLRLQVAAERREVQAETLVILHSGQVDTRWLAGYRMEFTTQDGSPSQLTLTSDQHPEMFLLDGREQTVLLSVWIESSYLQPMNGGYNITPIAGEIQAYASTTTITSAVPPLRIIGDSALVHGVVIEQIAGIPLQEFYAQNIYRRVYLLGRVIDSFARR